MTPQQIREARELCERVTAHSSIEQGRAVGCRFCIDAAQDEASAICGTRKVQDALADALAENGHLRALLAESLTIASRATPPEHTDIHDRIAAIKREGGCE